jgi:hypothetical protein
LAKKNLRQPVEKRLKNSGTRYAPIFLKRFLFDGLHKQVINEKMRIEFRELPSKRME